METILLRMVFLLAVTTLLPIWTAFGSPGSRRLTADAGPDRFVADQDHDAVELVWLDGRKSRSPRGEIIDWVWTKSGQIVARGETPLLNMGLGIHQLVLTVTDRAGASASDPVTITVGAGSLALRSIAEGGWTTFIASPDTRIVYVSSSCGDNANDGLSPETAVATITQGKSLLRDGYPDWLLLKRGDVWSESLGNWWQSGRSPAERIVVGAYGKPDLDRPHLRTYNGPGISFPYVPGAVVHDVAFVDLHLDGRDRSAGQNPNGFSCIANTRNLLIEGCWITGYATNIQISGAGPGNPCRHDRTHIRRNVVTDAFWHGEGANGHAMYLSVCFGLLIEENVLDENSTSNPSNMRHGIYIAGNGADENGVADHVVRRNIVSRSSSHGIQLRSGGTVEQNLFVRNGVALQAGGGNDTNDGPFPGGVVASLIGNVILEGKDITPEHKSGWGIMLANIRQGICSGNVIAHQAGQNPLSISVGNNQHNGVGVLDTVISGNTVYGWNGQVRFVGTLSQMNVWFEGNDIQEPALSDFLITHSEGGSTAGIDSDGNRFHCVKSDMKWMYAGASLRLDQWAPLVQDTTSQVHQTAYLDPGRSVGSYNGMLGGQSSLDAFMQEARRQRKGNWRPSYATLPVLNYIRAGFGLQPLD